MKFRLSDTHRYWWPVTVKVPAASLDDAGALEEQELRLQFETLPRAESLARQKAYDALTTAAERAEHEFNQLADLIRDWDGVVDEAGKPLAFSPEALGQALGLSWFRAAVYLGYAQSLNGEAARRGN